MVFTKEHKDLSNKDLVFTREHKDLRNKDLVFTREHKDLRNKDLRNEGEKWMKTTNMLWLLMLDFFGMLMKKTKKKFRVARYLEFKVWTMDHAQLLQLAQAQQQLLARYGLIKLAQAQQQLLTHYSSSNNLSQDHLTGLVPQATFEGSSGQATFFMGAFNSLTHQDFDNAVWNMDTGASSHLNSNANNLNIIYNKSVYPSVFVGDGKSIPVTNTGHSLLLNPHRPLHLHNVLISPYIVKNLISVRQFTRDNKVSIEFDEFGFSVKDYLTRQILLRCLYPVTTPTSYPQAFLASHCTWHQRLGHPGNEVPRSLLSNNDILCNKVKSPHLCHACQLGKHVRLPFFVYDTVVNFAFDIVHSDLWTSPLPSQSGIKYYVIFLDHFSHYLWVYPLRNKSDTFAKFVEFRSLVKTQFNAEIKAFQCDHGGPTANPNNTGPTTTPVHTGPTPPVQPNGQTPLPHTPDLLPIPLTPGPTTHIPHTTDQNITPVTTIPTPLVQPNLPPHPMPNPAVPNPHPNPTSTHPMVTRFHVGTNKKNLLYNCHVSAISPVPKSSTLAIKDPNRQRAILDEYNALIKNNTWVLVPRPPNTNIVRSMCDYDETFSPVVKPATIRTVLILAASRHWPVHQLDVKNAFLHGTLSETVYMHQPPGFRDPRRPDHVCLLQQSLYGFKQAPHAWFQRFASYATRIGFSHSRCDSSLFIYKQGFDVAYLLLYVDGILLTASSTALLQRIIDSLHQEFSMTDLGPLNYFLGISVTLEILERVGMRNCHSCRTPVDTESKLGADGTPVADPTLYRSLAGALQYYLTFTRPDLSYAVQQLYSSSTSSLVAYSDADWAGCPTTRRSTSGYCVFLGNNLLSWSSKRQCTLSRSSAEADYHGIANAVAETSWLRNLLCDLHSPLHSATIVYCDNISAVYMSFNPVQHQRTKHLEIDIHFVRDRVAASHVRVLHVPSRYQYADIFTKCLPFALFDEFRSSLSVQRPPAPTAGGC
ncbi:hypothetical protein CTI12_AA431350 [Artemisia annua]|uniref:Uncharacterized protein n=1 Tax=Artemisia annua TaxID=35608 RepID=A0A2U1M0Y7_ARTAN|nr:hypothetical protein CTI12_AA431350 [Artemisia annua]